MAICPTPTITATPITTPIGPGWFITVDCPGSAYIHYWTNIDPELIVDTPSVSFEYDAPSVIVSAWAFNPFTGLTMSATAVVSFPIPPPKQVATPTFTPVAGNYSSPKYVEILCATPDAAIIYTIDGTTPSETNGYRYDGFYVAVSSSTNLQAIACYTGMIDSAVASAQYNFWTPPPELYDTLNGGTFSVNYLIQLIDANSLATIIYTIDGSAPTHSGSTVTNGFIYTSSGIWLNTPQVDTFVHAVAFSGTDPDSSRAVFGPFTIDGTTSTTAAATPTLSPPPGTYPINTIITMSDSTPGAFGMFTIDGSLPLFRPGNIGGGIGSLFYNFPASVDIGTTPGTVELRVIAGVQGLNPSPDAGGAYTFFEVCATPGLNPPPGTYSSTQTVTIGCATLGATIRYTTDGSTPSETNGTIYTGVVSVPLGTVLRAIAYLPGMIDSPVVGGLYANSTLQCATPTFSPAAGTFTSTQQVTITSATAGASIVFTIDGTFPNDSDNPYIWNGTLYTSPVNVGQSLTIKAVAYKDGMTDSAMASATYVINYDPGPGPADSPWPMIGHDAQRTRCSQYSGFTTPPMIKWKYAGSFNVEFEPVIGTDGTVYVTDGSLLAVNPDGTLKWTYTNSLFTINCTPALASDGTIYVIDARGYLIAINADGTLKWSLQVMPGITCTTVTSPIIAPDGTLYLITLPNTYQSPCYMLAIHPDGTIKWTVTLQYLNTSPTIPNCISGMSPSLDAAGNIYTGQGVWGPVYGGYGYTYYAVIYNPNGTVNSSYESPAAFSISLNNQVNDVHGHVPGCVGQSGMLFIAGIVAPNPNNLSNWMFLDNVNTSAPALAADGSIYYGTYYGPQANKADGSTAWVPNNWGDTFTPTVDHQGNVFFGSTDYLMWAYDHFENTWWNFDCDGQNVTSILTIGTDGTIYVMGEYYLYALAASPTPPAIPAVIWHRSTIF